MKIHRVSLTSVWALALGTLLACGTVGIAQDAKDAPPAKKRGFSPEQQLERLNTELSLTDTQKPKVKELLASTAKKREELRGLAQDERREKNRALMEEQNKKMKEILTADQFEKYQKMMERRRQRGGGPGAASAPPAKSDADKKKE